MKSTQNTQDTLKLIESFRPDNWNTLRNYHADRIINAVLFYLENERVYTEMRASRMSTCDAALRDRYIVLG